MPFLIDGYNLLRMVEKTAAESESISDTGMCRVISSYLRQVGDSGQVVFDGIGPPDKTGFENFANLEVIFSGRSKDADSVIEDKITANSAPKNLVVVSSDRRLRIAARKRKAPSLKAEQFWQDVNSRLSQRKRSPAEPSAKRHGLSDSETDQWLKTFGLQDE